MSGEFSFSIKETSDQTGLSKDTIRYYEKIGLYKTLFAVLLRR
ncbi:MerR family DNA-binding transcriptional regulator [Paenibacillus sp. Aloe-11]